MILPDINLLVYAHDTSAPEHAAAAEWWERTVGGPEPVGLVWVVVLGFVRLLSSPRVVTEPSPPAELLETVEEILSLPAVRFAAPGSRHLSIMRRLFLESGATGRLTTDIHLAASAIELGGTLATNDSDFLRFSELKVMNPLSKR